MKIVIKKKYLGTISTGITGFLGYYYISLYFEWLSHQDFSVLLIPLIFLISLFYTITYWMNLRYSEKLSKEVGEEVSKGDPNVSRNVTEHLWKKAVEDVYTVNIEKWRIKLTSNWTEQKQFEKR